VYGHQNIAPASLRLSLREADSGFHPGTFPGGIELATGLGVMEYHDAHW